VTSPAALHSSGDAEAYTPRDVIAAAREVLGTIDVDPFSCPQANTVVQAETFYSPQNSDGYAEEWGDGDQAFFCNPPSDRVKRKPARALKPLVKPGQIHGWWKACDEIDAGRALHGIFLCFNMNLFQTGQRFGYPAPYSFPFVVPDKRLKFWAPGRAEGEGAPSHASAIVYLPPRGAERDELLHRLHTFAKAFAPLGAVRL
jgi:hypothetical protein